MSVSIELLLMLLAAVGVTISVGTLNAMSFEEKAALGDSLLNQIHAGTRQDKFIQDLIKANEDYETQKKDAIVTNLDGTKTQIKPITIGLPDRTFQNLRKYAVGINKGTYSLKIETLVNVKNYTDIVNYFLTNDLVETDMIGALSTRIQNMYDSMTYKKNILLIWFSYRDNSYPSSLFRHSYYMYGSDYPIEYDSEYMHDVYKRVDYIFFKPVYNTINVSSYGYGLIGYSDDKEDFNRPQKINIIGTLNSIDYFQLTSYQEHPKTSTGLSYREDLWVTKTLIKTDYLISKNATSTTDSESYDIAGVGSIAKNPNRVLTIADLDDAISKVGVADLVGTNAAEKVIPYDTTTDKTIADDIPITDAIENLDNSLPIVNTIPSLPQYVDGGSSTNSLFKMYHVTTSAQLPQLASILWDENIISQLQKWISNPMDYIVSLQAFPISPIDGEMEDVKLGSFSTNLSMKKVANQFMSFSCGSVRVDKKFFNFLDTITTIDIYLPFIGIFPLNTTQVMGGKLSVDYQIDFLSGSCVANIRLIKNNQNVIISTNSGNMSAVLPLSSKDFSNVYGALIGTVGGAIGTAVGFASGNVAMGTASALGTLNNVSGFRQGVRNSGAINGNSGLLNYKKPFLIINRPIPKIPTNYGHSVGYLDNTERYLNQVSGFSKFTNVDLSSVTLTELEKDRIKQNLEDGCIF